MWIFARMFFFFFGGGCLDVWMWILCGYYYLLECFWTGLEVWKWISCGFCYLLECFWGASGCLDVDKPKWEAGEATCSMLFTVRHVWNRNGLYFSFSSPSSSQIITRFTRLQHIYRHTSSVWQSHTNFEYPKSWHGGNSLVLSLKLRRLFLGAFLYKIHFLGQTIDFRL